PAPPPEKPAWRVVEVIGGPGSGCGEFASPGGITVDAAGNLYVADSYNHRLQRITPAGDVAAVARRGSHAGELLNPQGIAVDEHGYLYVVEQGNHRVQVFDPDGDPFTHFGRFGHGRDCFHSPAALAFGPCGTLF